MVNIPITTLQAKYQEYANSILNDINLGQIILYYDKQTLDTGTSDLDNLTMTMDSYGGRQPSYNLNDRQDETSTSAQWNNQDTETIKCRSYWQSNNANATNNISNDANICKIIVTSANNYKLKNATKAKIDGKFCKLVKGPTDYGLFGKQYTVSYWKEIGMSEE